MLGAIIGDISGSIYEWHPIKTKNFDIFSKNSYFTDDTVMTVAIADWLLTDLSEENLIEKMQSYGRRYPDSGYGTKFKIWLQSKNPKPYNSFGNGSAMRVSPVAWAFETLEEVEKYAEKTAKVTHNHPEGIKGAKSTAAAIFLARKNKTKAEIKKYIEEKYDYDLSKDIEEIKKNYKYDVTSQGSVPESIMCYLQSENFEDTIKNAISFGGDADTMAAIAGSIAEAEYGISTKLRDEAKRFLTKDLNESLEKFENIFGVKNADI